MKTATILIAALVLSTAILAAAPAAEAKQACVYDGRDPCDDYLVCVWNRLTQDWECFGHVGCLHRCWYLP